MASGVEALAPTRTTQAPRDTSVNLLDERVNGPTRPAPNARHRARDAGRGDDAGAAHKLLVIPRVSVRPAIEVARDLGEEGAANDAPASAERIALAVAGSQEGIWDWDLRRGDMYLSPQWKRLVGYDDFDLPNGFETWARLLHPEDVARTTQELVDYIEGRRQTFRAEFRQTHRDGTCRWILAQATALRDESGRAYRVAGSHTDITARKQAELERDRFFSLSRDPFCVLDAEHRILRVNPAFEEILGWSGDAVRGQRWVDYLHPADGGDPIVFGAQEHAHQTFENRYRCKDGSYRWLSWSAVRSDGLIYGTARDVTDRKELEQELRRARDLAVESARLKSEFLANMSHEIRTPMNGVLGMASLLRDTHLDEEQRRCVEAIVRSGESLLVILNDVLDFSKIEAGKLTLESADVDIRSCVDDVLELLAERAEERRVALSVSVAPEVPPIVSSDAGRLKQILMNLVSNAIKFTEHGSVHVRAQTIAEDGATLRIRFEVIDTGIGIAPETLARLFRPFTQADGSTTRKYGGTGLGLAICRRLCALMGGEIDATSEPGQGSTFRFSVVVTRAAPGPSAMTRSVVAERKFLCAGGDELWRQTIARQLREHGGTVDTEAHLSVAIAKIRRAPLETFAALLIVTREASDAAAASLILQDHTDEPLPPIVLLAAPRHAVRASTAIETVTAVRARTVPLPIQQSRLDLALSALWQTSTPPPTAAASALARFAPHDAATCGAPTSDAARSSPAPALAPTRRPRVLVAEDNQINQQLALKMLERLGCDVDLADDGAIAVMRAAATAYDLIFMDCQMPNLDGFEATRAIRAETGPCLATPIVALTANALEGDRQRCIDAGMNDYVAKPISRKELERVVRAIRLRETEDAPRD
jgi:PAS domain S-box-containing protein